MAVETDDDRAIFFDPDDFGDVATIVISGGATLEDVPGIYDGPHLVRGVKQDNQFTSSVSVDVSMQKPVFRCRTSDIPGVKNGKATITITSSRLPTPTVFTVFDVGPDGTGLTILTLMKA
jgi:hypothetical protein